MFKRACFLLTSLLVTVGGVLVAPPAANPPASPVISVALSN